jgi:hypothetical protein
MLVIQTDSFSLCVSLVLCAEELKVNSHYFQLNHAVFSPTYLSLSTKTHSFADGAPANLENKGQYLLWDMHLVTYPNWALNSPLKSVHFLSEGGDRALRGWLPVLFIWRVINLISFSSKPCSCYLWVGTEARGRAFWYHFENLESLHWVKKCFLSTFHESAHGAEPFMRRERNFAPFCIPL